MTQLWQPIVSPLYNSFNQARYTEKYINSPYLFTWLINMFSLTAKNFSPFGLNKANVYFDNLFFHRRQIGK
jgi:hypothetical protein